MPLAFTLPEDLKVVRALTPTEGPAGVLRSDYVSVKNLQKLFIVVQYNQGDATDQTWRPMKDISVAGAASVVLTQTVPIWRNQDCAASDTLIRLTNALNATTGVGQDNKMIIFQIDPAYLGMDGNDVPYDCICVETVGAVAATSWGSALFIGVPRYPAPVDQQLSIITN